MEKIYFLIFGALILGFSASMSYFALISKKRLLPNTGILTILIAGITALFFLTPIKNDSLTTIGLMDIFALFSGLIILSFAKNKFFLPALILSSLLITGAAPLDFELFSGAIPFILDRIIIFVLILAFSWSCQYLNTADGLFASQISTIAAGMFFLFLIGALPLFLGSISSFILGLSLAFVVYSWFPSRLKTNPNTISSLGFLAAWLLLKTCQEGAYSCAIILSCFLIVEASWASFQKIFPKNHGTPTIELTNTFQAGIKGLSPSDISFSALKIFALLLIFSSFQVYAPNSFSIPTLSLLITAWFANKLTNWDEPQKTLKEINKEVIDEIKENIKEIKGK